MSLCPRRTYTLFSGRYDTTCKEKARGIDMTESNGHALVIVDPQNDFCDPKGSLFVDGAVDDVTRLAFHLTEGVCDYTDVFVSLDCHDAVAIFHPRFWVDGARRHPAPFTKITPEDVQAGVWRSSSMENAKYASKAMQLLRSRAEKDEAFLMVWPEHCIVSTWGQMIAEPLRRALDVWRNRTARPVRYIFKGENPYTDQFSIFEGVDESWPDTAFNEPLFEHLAFRKSVTFAGEALSHCVEASISSFVRRRGSAGQEIKLLSDCTTPVAGFERSASMERLAALGVKFVASGAAD